MSRKKMIVVAIVLALVLLIGGLIAYFTDVDTATNEFTLGGEVDIEITETGWTQTSGSNNWTNANAQGIHPGANVAKAPVIHNNSSTTTAYVFAEVVVPCYDSNGDTTLDTDLYTFTANSGWTLINTPTIDTTTGTKTYVYAYGTASAMTTLAVSSDTTSAVFSSVTLAPTLTAAQKNTVTTPNIVVTAKGIQTDSLGVTAAADIYDLL